MLNKKEEVSVVGLFDAARDADARSAFGQAAASFGKGIAFGLIWAAVITYTSQSLFHRNKPTETDQESSD